MTNMIPSFLLSSCFLPVNMKMNSIRVARNIIAMSKITNSGIATGFISGTIPRTQRMLKILEPMMFPTARSIFFLIAATTQTASSGRLVPIAIIVADIRNSLRPNC